MGIKFSLGCVVPFQIQDRLRENCIFVMAVQVSNLFKEIGQDFTVRFGISWWLSRFIPPLHPATTIGNGTFFFHRHRTGQHKDLCLNLLWIHTRALPERACLIVKDINIDQPIQFCHRLPCLVGIGPRTCGVHTPGKQSFYCVLIHLIKDIEPGIGLAGIQLGNPWVSEIVFFGGLPSKKGFQ